MSFSGSPQYSTSSTFTLTALDPLASQHMTLLEMQQLFYDLTRDKDKTGREADEVTRLLNLELREFLRAAPVLQKSGVATLAVGNEAVTLPEEFMATTVPAVWREDEPLEFLARRDMSPVRRPGRATRYFIEGRTIVFDTAASEADTLTVRLRMWPATLVEPSHVPEIDREYHEGIVFAAVADAFWADREPEQAAFWRARASEYVDKARSTLVVINRSRRRRGDDDDD